MIMILMIITRNPLDLPIKAMETCVFIASCFVSKQYDLPSRFCQLCKLWVELLLDLHFNLQ